MHIETFGRPLGALERVTLTDSLVREVSYDIVHNLDWTVPLSNLLPTSDTASTFRSVSVFQIGLSVRSLNCLLSANIVSVDQLLSATIDDLLKVRNMGVRSIWNIVQRLVESAQVQTIDNSAEAVEAEEPKLEIDYTALIRTFDLDRPLWTLLLVESAKSPAFDVSISLLRLSKRARNCLDTCGVITVADLALLTLRELMKVRSMGRGTINHIVRCLDIWCSMTSSGRKVPFDMACGESCKTDQVADEHEEAVIHEFSDSASTVLFDIAAASLTPCERKLLCNRNITNFSAFCRLTSRTESINGALKRKIIQLVDWAREAASLARHEHDPELLRSHYFKLVFDRDISTLVENVTSDGTVRSRIVCILSSKPAVVRAFIERLQGRTLDEIGGMLGVCKERARQLILKATKIVEKHPGFMEGVVNRVLGIVTEHGGCLGIDELAAMLDDNAVMAAPAGQKRLVSFLSTLCGWKEAGIVILESDVVLPSLWNRVSDIIRRVGEPVARSVSDDVVGSHLWSSPYATVLLETGDIISDELYNRQTCVTVSPKAFTLAIGIPNYPAKIDGDRIYSIAYWDLLFGFAIRKIEAVLLSAGQPMHFTAILREIGKYTTNVVAYDAFREDSSLVIAWGRGTYIHRNYVQLDSLLLNRISGWLDAKLGSGAPMVSVRQAYDEFETECLTAGIPNSHALHSSLRLGFPSMYQMKRYPYIAPLFSQQPKSKISRQIEDYVLAQGGYVPRKAIADFLRHDLGLDSMSARQCTLQANNLLSGRGWVIHGDNVAFDKQALAELTEATVLQAASAAQVTVTNLIDTNCAAIARLGISDARLIHSLILRCASGKLRGRFPSFVAADKTSEVKSIIAIIAEFVKDRHGPCSLPDVQEYLIQEYGVKESHVWQATMHRMIVRYSPGVLIHLDTIQWNAQKQSVLDEYAQIEYCRSVEQGNLHAIVSSVLERWKYALPQLCGHDWTETLIAELLLQANRWLIVGNAHKAFMPVDNKYRIRTLDDFVATHITRCYSGRARLADVRNELREGGIITKGLRQSMLGKNSVTVVTRKIVALRSLQ